MKTNIIYSHQASDSFINGLTVCYSKVLENDFSHIRVHFPETENNMEAILFIGHDRAKGVCWSYFRNYYYDTDGQRKYCDSQRDTYGILEQLCDDLDITGNNLDRYDYMHVVAVEHKIVDIPDFAINTTADIKTFFSWLLDHDMLIHPDDSFIWFLDFADDDAPAIITAEQAKKLDTIMHRCFDVCEATGTDIYDIALQFGWKR